MRMSTKKEKQPKTSTVLLFSIIVFILGLYLISYNYLVSKKEKIYSKMNLLLYDDETPKTIENVNSNDNDVNNEQKEEQKEKQKDKKLSYNYIGKLQIDKINLNRGFLDISSPYNNVNRNITVIDKSSYPDVENGNLIIAAHSGNCPICYFDKLYNKLDESLKKNSSVTKVTHRLQGKTINYYITFFSSFLFIQSI